MEDEKLQENIPVATEPASVGKNIPDTKQKSSKSSYANKLRNAKPRQQKDQTKDEFEQRILDLARVTRVMAGGKRMRFRACVVIGDKKGKVGVALGKGADVTLAVNKAVNRAKKNLVDVPMINETIPHEMKYKYGAAKIFFKPAAKGSGVIAGGVVRIILELAGIKNVSAKTFGTNNKVTNAKCTIEALKRLKRVEERKNVTSEKKIVVESKTIDDNKKD